MQQAEDIYLCSLRYSYNRQYRELILNLLKVNESSEAQRKLIHELKDLHQKFLDEKSGEVLSKEKALESIASVGLSLLIVITINLSLRHMMLLLTFMVMSKKVLDFTPTFLIS